MAMQPASTGPVTRFPTVSTMKLLFICVMVLVLAFFCMPHDAVAQTTAPSSGAGDSMWTSAKSTLFSGWGMLISLLIVGVGVFVWMRRGIGEGLVVMIAGFGLFLAPALVIAARNAGQSMATASIEVPYQVHAVTPRRAGDIA